jgi:gliding motility-associated-like protein
MAIRVFNFLLLLSIISLPFSAKSQVFGCNQLQPFCTSNIYNYQAGYDPNDPGAGNGPQASTISPGNNYGCLTTQPNPVWFYLEIDQPGNLQITLSNSQNLDIDYICYGPFNNLAAAQAGCGSYTFSTTTCIPLFSTCPGGAACTGSCYSNGAVDCSYDPQATETVNIPSAQAGQVYVLLITNFSNSPTTITAQKTGGTATTNCAIIEPGCAANAGNVQGNKNIDLCADDNAVTLSTTGFTSDSLSPRDVLRWGVWLRTDPNSVINPQNPGPIPNDDNPFDDANFVGFLAQKGASITFSPTADGVTYFVAPLWVDSVTNTKDSCTGLNPTQGYTIYNNPPLTFTQNILGCDVNITLGGGHPSVNPSANYSWSYIDPQGNTVTGTGSSITFSATINGTYTYSITNDGKNCDLPGFLTAFAGCDCPPNSDLGLTLVNKTDVSCIGDTDGSIEVQGSLGLPGYQYNINGGTFQNSGIFTGLAPGSYTVGVLDQNGCNFSLTVVVGEPPVLSLNVNQTKDVSCAGGSDGEITVLGSGGNGGYTYSINGVNFQNANNFTGLAINTYTITVRDNKGCTATTDATLSEPSIVTAIFNTTPPACVGFSNATVEVIAAGGTPGYQYQFSRNGDINATGLDSNYAAGNYTFTVYDANNCAYTQSFQISDPLPFDIAVTPSNPKIEMGDSIQLNVTGSYPEPYTYLWEPATGLSCTLCQNPFTTLGKELTYTVTATTADDCVAKTTVKVDVERYYDHFIPNAITPNGDGNNDVWQIFGKKKNIKSLEAIIFNRWGEKVFDSKDKNLRWDGNYKGQAVAPGTYTYIVNITFLDGKEENAICGSLTVIR